MTIKEIIDAERWYENEGEEDFFTLAHHNACLGRIQAAVDARIKELEAQIFSKPPSTELTRQLRNAVEYSGDPADYSDYAYQWQDKPHRLVWDACDRIDELEAQIAATPAVWPESEAIMRLHEETRKQRERIAELEAAIDEIAGYVTIETHPRVIEIINKTAR